MHQLVDLVLGEGHDEAHWFLRRLRRASLGRAYGIARRRLPEQSLNLRGYTPLVVLEALHRITEDRIGHVDSDHRIVVRARLAGDVSVVPTREIVSCGLDLAGSCVRSNAERKIVVRLHISLSWQAKEPCTNNLTIEPLWPRRGRPAL